MFSALHYQRELRVILRMSMIFLVISAALVGSCLGYTCGDAPDTNGCSAWDIVPYKSYFESQCNKHDVCYACGEVFNLTRSACDDAFLEDLYDRCDGGWFCNFMAWSYYTAVDLFGRGYRDTSPSWCTQESWIEEKCLP